MESVKVDDRELTKQAIFNEVKAILSEVAPLKIIGEITLESSLIENFAFDSIDIIDTFLKIQEKFAIENDSNINFGNFLADGISGFDASVMTMDAICTHILKSLNKR